MILLWGVAFGLLAGYLRSLRGGCTYQAPSVRGIAVVIVAFVPQFLAFYVPFTRTVTTDRIASVALVASLVLLLFFVWLNRRTPAFWLMGAGLLLNLLVIVANGGLMPISPDTIQRLAPEMPAEMRMIGSRLGSTKDIILSASDTRFEWLADRHATPPWYPQKVAFSFGDVLIAFGVFGLFLMAGKCPAPSTT